MDIKNLEKPKDIMAFLMKIGIDGTLGNMFISTFG
jgi:hypothetical protein